MYGFGDDALAAMQKQLDQMRMQSMPQPTTICMKSTWKLLLL